MKSNPPFNNWKGGFIFSDLLINGLYSRENPVSLTPTVPGSGMIETDKYKYYCKLVILKYLNDWSS